MTALKLLLELLFRPRRLTAPYARAAQPINLTLLAMHIRRTTL